MLVFNLNSIGLYKIAICLVLASFLFSILFTFCNYVDTIILVKETIEAKTKSSENPG